VVLCRDLKLFAGATVAVDGSKFKAINNRDRNCTRGDRRMTEDRSNYVAVARTFRDLSDAEIADITNASALARFR
jgi:hypothetical protein